jgi:hypothetical protein
MPDSYRPERDVSPKFLDTVSQWIEAAGEVFVMLRYLRAGGAKGYAFIHSPNEFQRLVEACSTGTDIIVFRDRQLPLRGQVDDDFIARARTLIPAGAAYMGVRLAPRTLDDPRLDGFFDDSMPELESELEASRGEALAFGPLPPFLDADNEAMISAAKGGIDGPR